MTEWVRGAWWERRQADPPRRSFSTRRGVPKGMSGSCPICGYDRYDIGVGHPWAGKRTPPKTRWCTGGRG